jgi:AcrR family transcriptional regulator
MRTTRNYERDGNRGRPVSVSSAGDRRGAQVVEMQRRRLLTATIEIVYERGVRALTPVLVCQRAGMSRRTFYSIFEGREGCLLAAFEHSVEHAVRAVEQASVGEQTWVEGIRAGLGALLSFVDYEPGMGRLLVVEALGSDTGILEARQSMLAQITRVIDRGREVKTGRRPPPLTAEGIVGAVFSVVHTRMLERDPRALAELAGPLMAMIVGPYLGPAAARRELDQPPASKASIAPRFPTDPFKDLPIRITYRTALTLTTIARTPGASSKQIADAAGIHDEGQTSKLLHRLQHHGLISDTGIGPTKGMPRAWTLTQRGEHVLQALGQ